MVSRVLLCSRQVRAPSGVVCIRVVFRCAGKMVGPRFFSDARIGARGERSLVTLAMLAVSICVAAPSNAAASYLSPEVLNSHVVFSRGCSKIIYSSNRNGPVRPFVVDMTDPTQPTVTAVELPGDRDFLVQSLAPDCRTVAMVSDRYGDGTFEIYLYDLRQGTLRDITKPGPDEGKAAFAPRGRILAYLSDKHLSLYDYAKSIPVEVANPTERFTSVTWSESGGTVYLEDELTNIWEYNLQLRRFRKTWDTPRMSYSPRTIFERNGHLLFASDHESEYSQIYRFNLASGSLEHLYSSPHDQHSPREWDPGHYTFRSVVDASFIAAELRNGKYHTLSPPAGVAYDLSLAFGTPLLLYADDRLPMSLYWSDKGKLRPLLPVSYESRQPDAIPIKNASGMTNFLYLPSKAPKAWVVWLHGGPQGQVSPRFNLYFDFFARRNIAVYPINYPGSTGIGNSYALSGEGRKESIAVELPAVERDIQQLRQLHPEISSYILVGVSYGSILAHLLAAKHPEVSRLVDFSGIADSSAISNIGSNERLYPPMLAIYGENDFSLRNPARSDLLSKYAEHASASRLILPKEGHDIQRRGSIDRILLRLDAFLKPSTRPNEKIGGTSALRP